MVSVRGVSSKFPGGVGLQQWIELPSKVQGWHKEQACQGEGQLRNLKFCSYRVRKVARLEGLESVLLKGLQGTKCGEGMDWRRVSSSSSSVSKCSPCFCQCTGALPVTIHQSTRVEHSCHHSSSLWVFCLYECLCTTLRLSAWGGQMRAWITLYWSYCCEPPCGCWIHVFQCF